MLFPLTVDRERGDGDAARGEKDRDVREGREGGLGL